jgi:hypothetical protein
MVLFLQGAGLPHLAANPVVKNILRRWWQEAAGEAGA